MAQLINFDQLKEAFAPEAPAASVAHLPGAVINQRSDAKSNIDTDVLKENRQLKELLKAKEDQLASVDSEFKKSQRQRQAMAQEKQSFESDFQRLHDDKIRLVRSLNEKQNDIENFKKSINRLESDTRALKVKFSHSKHSVKKLSEKNNAQKNEINSLMHTVKQMNDEIAQLQEAKKLHHLLKEQLIEYSQIGLGYLNQAKDKVLDLVGKKTPKAPEIKWIPLAARLPKTQCMVYVRNENESDVAFFNPTTQQFKCAHKPIKILEWSPAS